MHVFILYNGRLNLQFRSIWIIQTECVCVIITHPKRKSLVSCLIISFLTLCDEFELQKARLARIRIAKASSGAAFVTKKKAVEARLAAQESGLEIDDGKEDDIFELQHHHLLRCLEKTTVSQTSLFLPCSVLEATML